MKRAEERLAFTSACAFEAARQVPSLPAAHRAGRLHGHSFCAKVRARLPQGFALPGTEVPELRRRLQTCVAPLDYGSLNALLEVPTDENLARWLKAHLDLPHVDGVGVQSTLDQGVDLDGSERAQVWRRYAFQAAHRLPHVPPGHKCGRMHGHGFEVVVHAARPAPGGSPGIDYDRIDSACHPILAPLEHSCLNEIEGLENPTSELIARWIWERLKTALPEAAWVTVYETASCGAHYDGARYRIWKEMTLDSAVRLRRLPRGHPRSAIHGHTFTLRLHLGAPLDEVLGWTVDFGDVKQLFAPVFGMLDHRPLYELAGVEDNDAASVLRWIRARAADLLPALDRIDLCETRGCGATLSWGDEPPPLPV